MDYSYQFDKPTFPRSQVFEILNEVLTHPSFVILPALLDGLKPSLASETIPVPGLMRSITFVLSQNGMLEKVIKYAVEDELKNTPKQSLFRESSLAAVLIQNSFKILGQDYLREVFKGPVRGLFSSSVDLEINPNFIKDEDTRKKNKKDLEEWTGKFFQAFFNSHSEMPPVLRNICKIIYECVMSNYAADPECQKVAKDSVCTFLVLRFVTLALVSNKEYGLTKGAVTNPKQSRNLVLIAKILQSFAFGNIFQSYLDEINHLIEENHPKFNQFLDKILAGPTCASCDDLPETNINTKEFQEEAAVLIKYISSSDADVISRDVLSKVFPSLRQGAVDGNLPVADVLSVLACFTKMKWIATTEWFSETGKEKPLPLPSALSKTTKILSSLGKGIMSPKKNTGDLITAYTSAEEWFSATLQRYKYVVLIFFRGSFCMFCKKQLKDWNAMNQLVQQSGGAIFGISAEEQEPLSDFQEKWELAYDLVSDPSGHLADLYNVVQDNSPIWSILGKFKNGVATQPSILVVSKEREILYFWRSIPNESNVYGAKAKPVPIEVVTQVIDQVCEEQETFTFPGITKEKEMYRSPTMESIASDSSSSKESASTGFSSESSVQNVNVMMSDMDIQTLHKAFTCLMINDNISVVAYEHVKAKKKAIRATRNKMIKESKGKKKIVESIRH